jgi:hypothetical protein
MFIDTLIRYIDDRSPGFAQRIGSLPDNVVDEFERFVGQPLPLVYRQFLLAMGGGMAEWVFKDRDLDIDSVMAHLGSTVPGYPIDRYCLFCIHDPPADIVYSLDWYFDLTARVGDDCAVVAFDDRGQSGATTPLAVADSFQELVSTWSFRQFSLAPRQHRLSLQFYEQSPARETFVSATRLLERHGYVPALPVTRNCWAGEHPDGKAALVNAMADQSGSFFVDLAGDAPRALRDDRQRLERELETSLG